VLPESRAFFVPGVNPGFQETAYADLAKFCGRSVPSHGTRIYSLTFTRDQTTWTATVGEKLRGVHHRVTRSTGKRIERDWPVPDTALVLAIFPPSNPFLVATDGALRSAFANPFMVGEIESVTHFPKA
jgi:hypothetical protein